MDRLPQLIGGPRDGEYVAVDDSLFLVLPALTERGLVGHRYEWRGSDWYFVDTYNPLAAPGG